MPNYTFFEQNLKDLVRKVTNKELDADTIPFLYKKMQKIITFITHKLIEHRFSVHWRFIEEIVRIYFPKDIARLSISHGIKLQNEIFSDGNYFSYNTDLRLFVDTKFYFGADKMIGHTGIMLIGILQFIIEDLIDMSGETTDGTIITLDKIKEIISDDAEFNQLFNEILI